MMSPPDAFEALRLANPVPDESSVATLLLDPYAMLDTVLARSAPPAGRQCDGRRLVATVGVSAVALGGLVGGRYILDRPTTKPISVACFGSADLQARSVVDTGSGDPVDRCGQAWRDGAFGRVSDPPPLVECVLPSGAVGVFPGSSAATCDSLGAARPAPGGGQPPAVPGDGTGTAADAIALRTALTEAITSARCTTAEEARQVVDRELAARGLGAWRIQEGAGDGGGFDAVRRCASVAIDVERRLVILVPVPEAAPPGSVRRG